jgi:glycosyltransferase involved in cell wall biosynthesis
LNLNCVVIIPAYNEAQSIGFVLQGIPKNLVNAVIVVNNNSSDTTRERALEEGAIVLDEIKKGYGQACLKGIAYLDKLTTTPDIVIFMDADFSDYPEEIAWLLQPFFGSDIDLVIGSRTLGVKEKGALTPQQLVGNRIATFLLKLFYGVKYTDLGPFRAIRYNQLLALNMKDTTYGWTVEMQLKAAKNKMHILEVPVSYRKRIGTSKISGTFKGTILAGYKIISTIFKHL